MFVKLSTLALIVPYVAAFTMNAIEGGTTGGSVTISWSATTTDPTSFSVELTNSAFHNTYAIANNVPTAQGSLTVTLPQVPVGDGYTVEAVANNNVNQVYAQSGDFSIGAATTSSATASSTTSSSSLSSATDSTSSTSFSSTPSSTATVPVSSASPSVSAASSSTATSSPTTFNSSGAASFKLIGLAPAAALVLSAVAGAVMVF